MSRSRRRSSAVEADQIELTAEARAEIDQALVGFDLERELARLAAEEKAREKEQADFILGIDARQLAAELKSMYPNRRRKSPK